MTKKETQHNFTTVIAEGIITATSNKTSEDFKQEVATKTIYFTVTNEKDREKLVKLGMTEYTPEEDNSKPYFIAKATKLVKVYENKLDFEEINFAVSQIKNDKEQSTPNYYTENPVKLAIIKVKGGKGKNDFYRINAILVKSFDDLKETEPVNPFAELFAEENPFLED